MNGTIHPVLEVHILEFIKNNPLLFGNKKITTSKYSSIRMDYDRDGEETGAFVTLSNESNEYMFTAYTGVSNSPTVRMTVPFSVALKYLPYSITKKRLTEIVRLTARFMYANVFTLNFKNGIIDTVVYTQAVSANGSIEKTFTLYKNNENEFKNKFDYYMYSFLDSENVFKEIIYTENVEKKFLEFMSKKDEYMSIVEMKNV